MRLTMPRLAQCATPRGRIVVYSQAPGAAGTVPKQSVDQGSSLACPICQKKFIQDWRAEQSLSCTRCNVTYSGKKGSVAQWDLALSSGTGSYEAKYWAGTETFQNPLVSFVYERGWRQGFSWAGFPGVETEARMAIDFMEPAWGEPIVDLSCGSGLFTREFLASRKFPFVVASDLSETMLQQAGDFLKDKSASYLSDTVLVRADVSRLPFETGSVAAIHAGAAIHCWPDPLNALADISRALAPGGVFVGSTFMVPVAPLEEILGEEAARPLLDLSRLGPSGSSAYRWWEERELRDLCKAVGLTDFQRKRTNRFIMFSAKKPDLD